MFRQPLPPVNHTTKTPQRNVRDYQSLSRNKVVNHLKTAIKKAPPGHRLTDFLSSGFCSWVFHTIKSGFGKKHPYRGYPQGGFNGIYPLLKSPIEKRQETVVAIAADWATDTKESFAIGSEMARHTPEYTIHMGDTYYVGAPPEITANFLPVGNSPWPHGSIGSFALLGNHEMYSRGNAFFENLLGILGANSSIEKKAPQQAPFFCLENDHWRILGLDTGYNSVGFLDLGANCKFEDTLMTWLEEQVFTRKEKGLLILTHHQYITAFSGEKEFNAPATQLARFVGKEKPILWLWGHEHKFAMYGKAQVGDGATAFGRCIGHGGMPVELNKAGFSIADLKKGAEKLVAVDMRPYHNPYKLKLGFNGYALLRLTGDRLTIEYHDVHKLLVTETWQHTGVGNISPVQITCLEPALHPQPNKTWQDALK